MGRLVLQRIFSSVSDGSSPNFSLYAIAKRPRCVKPQFSAMSAIRACRRLIAARTPLDIERLADPYVSLRTLL